MACAKPSPHASLRWTLNYLADISSSPPADSRGMGHTLTSNPPHNSWLRKHPLSGKSRISTFHPNNTVLHNAMQQYKKKPNSLLLPTSTYDPPPKIPHEFFCPNILTCKPLALQLKTAPTQSHAPNPSIKRACL